MVKRKYYLAHPLDLREETREEELRTEEETGIELLNPFYDTKRRDIVDIDKGKMDRDSIKLNSDDVVESDLRGVHATKGTVGIIRRGTYSIGTICECWETLRSTRHPIFIISSDSLGHVWVRYLIKHSGGMGFDSWDSFRAWLKTSEEE